MIIVSEDNILYILGHNNNRAQLDNCPELEVVQFSVFVRNINDFLV